MAAGNDHAGKRSGYVALDGLSMYYESEGSGPPLVFIPPAFGFAGQKGFPLLARERTVITIDLQGNGRTADLPHRPLSIAQYAADVVGLLGQLGIARADFLGESYGACTAAMIAVRYPERVRRVAAYGATFGPPQVALDPQTTRVDQPPGADAGCVRYQRDGYRRVAPDPDYWPRIYEKVGGMQWQGFTAGELASIAAPMLIMVGDHDFVSLQHAVDAFRAIPHAQLAVIPDASHFALSSEQDKVIPIVRRFLEEGEARIPLATARDGYYPGETR